MADIFDFGPKLKPNELTDEQVKLTVELAYGMYNVVVCFSGTEQAQIANADIARGIIISMINIIKQSFDRDMIIELLLRMLKPLTITDKRYSDMYNHCLEIQKRNIEFDKRNRQSKLN